MYERFTDRARKVMQLANQEAQHFNHEYVGTEHVLLGLIKESSGVAANVLKNFDVDLGKIRIEVEKLAPPRLDIVTMGKLPNTPRTEAVLKCAIEEAKGLNHSYIGTEHLLLGLLHEQEGVVVQVLAALDIKADDVRNEVLEILGHGTDASAIQAHFTVTHESCDPGLSPPKRLAREIMGLTLWQYAELNKELRRLGIEGVSMHRAVSGGILDEATQMVWQTTVTRPVDLTADAEMQPKGE